MGVSTSVSGGGGVVEGGAEGPLLRDGVEELRSASVDAVVSGLVGCKRDDCESGSSKEERGGDDRPTVAGPRGKGMIALVQSLLFKMSCSEATSDAGAVSVGSLEVADSTDRGSRA